ncbi:MAG TPA: CatA-like O-acetyltransferase, partial [Spirochaetota bacterium]
MKEIDRESWERKEHYNFFSRMDYPHFNICFDVDITHLLPKIKSRNLSFYYAMIYIATVSAN